METVGFIGLGIMGAGMARNLLEAGADLTVWNRTAKRAAPLGEAGATVATSPGALAAACDVVVLCVSDTPDVEELVLGDGGVLDSIREGSLVIDCSTISPEATRRLASAASDRGVGFVDAPVSGGSEGAVQGTLSAMVGGSDTDVERARPVLDAFSARVTHVGDVSAGQAAKLVNQILVVVNMLGVSEALVFAAAHGLDLDRTLEAVTGGAAGSWMLANRGPQVIDRDWRPGFTIDLQQKDLRLVADAAAQEGVPVVATAIIQQLYGLLQADGGGGEGNHALVKAIERLAGVEVSR
ncbi:MAG: NAD(P)-dependent oxidoreductase [Nitriliruptoraceae bacterium]